MPRKRKRLKGALADFSRFALKLTTVASDGIPVPGLKGATGGVSHVWDKIEARKSNLDDERQASDRGKRLHDQLRDLQDGQLDPDQVSAFRRKLELCISQLPDLCHKSKFEQLIAVDKNAREIAKGGQPAKSGTSRYYGWVLRACAAEVADPRLRRSRRPVRCNPKLHEVLRLSLCAANVQQPSSDLTITLARSDSTDRIYQKRNTRKYIRGLRKHIRGYRMDTLSLCSLQRLPTPCRHFASGPPLEIAACHAALDRLHREIELALVSKISSNSRAMQAQLKAVHEDSEVLQNVAQSQESIKHEVRVTREVSESAATLQSQDIKSLKREVRLILAGQVFLFRLVG